MSKSYTTGTAVSEAISHAVAVLGNFISLCLPIRATDHSGTETHSDNRITYVARLNFRDDRRVFGIRQADRRAHMYIIGKTGTGKSSLMETLIPQDVDAGHGLALLDPHGDLVEHVLAVVPERRRDDLIYFNVPDARRPQSQVLFVDGLVHCGRTGRPADAICKRLAEGNGIAKNGE